MSRIKNVFGKGKAFIPFITAGDPNLEITAQLILEMSRAGADIIELGIPFSDPVAEGMVIQKADERALVAGTTPSKIFDMVRSIRDKTDVPLAFMTYFNPVFVHGVEKFAENCSKSGIDALIIPDLPFEEKDEILPHCKKYGIELISLIAPTSRERISMIAAEAQGFVYCVSSLGVTGVRNEINTILSEMIALVKEVQDIPCAIGFDVSTPGQAKATAQLADGVIANSAIVKLVEKYGESCIKPVADYVSKMKQAITE